MVNDSIEELMDLDMEPKPESLRWTSIFKDEGTATLRVGGRGKTWDLPFGEVFDVPGYRFHHDGKGFQGAERTMCKCLVSWWRDRFNLPFKDCAYDSEMLERSRPRLQHCIDRKHQLAVEWCHADEGSCMESQHLTSYLCERKNTGESGVNCRIRTAHSLHIKWKKMGLLFLTEKLLTNFGRLRTGLSMMVRPLRGGGTEVRG